MITNKYKIREHNEAQVLRGIIDHKNISRAELSSLTGLNKASVSSITKGLLDDGLIFETGIGAASTQGGRKPIMLQFNPKAAVTLSFDLGVNYLKGTLSYLNGETVLYVEKKRITVSAETALDLLEETIRAIHEKHPDLCNTIIGMTVGIHGVVHNHKIIFTPYYDLDTIDLYAELSQRFDFPIFLENEANLAALGEYTFSKDSESLVSLSIHSGIGAGIVDAGVVQKGKHGTAGEIGHSILYPAGKTCPCGNDGCLEQYASNTVLYQTVAEKKELDFVDSSVIETLKDDPVVRAELENNAFLLSVGINNIATLYDPEVVIINSSVYRRIPALLAMIQEHLSSRFAQNLHVQSSSLGNEATLYGGIALCCQNFLNIRQLKLHSIYD
ncbi:ROK family transcriptional regulator [Enterococcus sp. BWM-S5]|uniref:ROK family transcriptional regulator n=1 Tax=Enterococcus larvae TaxID=2794352 RepID=A0ABS4CHV4_9ENTE|nr:ROK family transcriptional regulator [Enterococcus larvae]MBP1046010.1 ROK family transcriptional regulator [Enterococcus larvae]